MKRLLPLAFLACITPSVRADIGIGDSLEQVVAEKGNPTGRMQAGDTAVLRFSDATIKFKAGKVISIDSAKPPHTATPKPQAPTAHTPAHAATASVAPTAIAPQLTWTTDYRAALALAKEQNRHVFLFFTGSDWCGWCMRLNQEILSTAEFARYAQNELVLVEADFPRGKSQSAALKAQNASLARAFQIEGYPTIIVLNQLGRVVGRLGYEEGGPGPFLKQLRSL